MEARACSLLLDEMARSQEGDVVGTSRVVVRDNVPKATSSGGEPKSVTDSLSGVTQTMPTALTSEKTSENSVNNGGAGGDSESLSSLQATVKLLSDQMAWFVDRLNEPEAELDNNSAVRDGAHGCVQPELAEEGEIVDALAEIGNAYADIANLGTEVDGQLATIVNNILTSRMTDEKVKEKMDNFIRPANCDKLEVSRVNVEIWDRLSESRREHVTNERNVCKSLSFKPW